MRNPWIIAQLVVAVLLVAVSIVGFIGPNALGLQLPSTLAGAVQTFFVFPGLVVSLVVNALIMRLHREIGISTIEKVLLIVEGLLIVLLIVFNFYDDPTADIFTLAVITWPIVVLVATAIAIIAGVRNGNRPVAPPAAPTG